MEPPTPLSTAEASALESLKSKINDPSLPTLDLARALQSHLDAYPQSQRVFAEKLGMPEKRSYLTEVIGLLRLPEADLAAMKGKVLTRRAIREAVDNDVDQRGPAVDQDVDHVDQGVDHVDQGVDHVDQSVDHPVDQPINGKDHVYLPKERSNPLDEGFPLLKDTVNTVSRLVFFWAKDADLGGLFERWAIKLSAIGWLKTAFAVAAIGLAAYGGWIAARDALRTVSESRGNGVTAFHTDTPIPRYSVTPSLGAPRLTGSRWISGHRLELRWQPQPDGTNYRVYWHSRDGRVVQPMGDVPTPGAIVNVAYMEMRRGGAVSVTAVSPLDEESAHSPLIAFEPTPVNQQDGVEPLPLVGAAASSSSSPAAVGGGSMHRQPMDPRPAPAGDDIRAGDDSRKGAAIPGGRLSMLTMPKEVHAEVKTPDLILLSWRAVGNSFRYNVYSSGTRDLAALRKENVQPLKANRVEWTPETGLPRYWIVVTSLDENGRESAYSEAIEVVRNPEKSGDSGAADAAAGIFRKVLPW